jgi:hypothetical protein
LQVAAHQPPASFFESRRAVKAKCALVVVFDLKMQRADAQLRSLRQREIDRLFP